MPGVTEKPVLWAVSSTRWLCAPDTDYQEGTVLVGIKIQ
jgi:hypothetical protein